MPGSSTRKDSERSSRAREERAKATAKASALAARIAQATTPRELVKILIEIIAGTGRHDIATKDPNRLARACKQRMRDDE